MNVRIVDVSFDQHADSYENEVEASIAFANVDHAFTTERKAEHLLDVCTRLLGSPSEQRVLDVGCGVGLTDALLMEHVGHLHGVDVSAASVERAAAANPTASYAAFDGTAFPLPDESIDLAFAICVLHHVEPEARPRFAAEMRRVVRPGGIVVLFEHNPFNPLTRVAVSRCEFDDGVTLSRRPTTARLLGRAGLVVEDGAFIIFTTSRRWSARADQMLGWCPAGAQYYVAARRPPRPAGERP